MRMEVIEVSKVIRKHTVLERGMQGFRRYSF